MHSVNGTQRTDQTKTVETKISAIAGGLRDKLLSRNLATINYR